jgi:hypothetical protein
MWEDLKRNYFFSYVIVVTGAVAVLILGLFDYTVPQFLLCFFFRILLEVPPPLLCSAGPLPDRPLTHLPAISFYVHSV